MRSIFFSLLCSNSTINWSHFFPPLSFFQGPHLPLMMASLSDQIKKIQVTTTYQTFVKEYMALLWSLIIISIILNIYFPKNVYIHTILSLKAQTAFKHCVHIFRTWSLCMNILQDCCYYIGTLSSVMRWNMFWVIALDISDPWIIGFWKYVHT